MDLNEIQQKRVVYQIAGMEQDAARKNVVYKRVDGLELRLDVYAPPGGSHEASRPAVLLVHGDLPPEAILGTKDGGPFVSLAQLIAASGVVAVTFDHRSTEQFTKMDAVIADIDDLLQFVRGHGPELGIDPNRLCAWSFSAGVPYGVYVALQHPEAIRCIVAYYGPLDLQPLYGHIPPQVTQDMLRSCSPLAQIEQAVTIPPLLVVRAGQDQPWLNQTIDRFVQQALARNLPVDLMSHPEGPHAFDILDDSQRSRTILRRTLDFILDHMDSEGSTGIE